MSDTRDSITPKAFIQANNIGFCEGNIIRLVSEWEHNKGLDDLYEAKNYLEFLICLAEKKTEEVQRKNLIN